VNTFGFGSNHNAGLLKAISKAGSGLYFYIENGDMIGDAFVDCMGGLLSTVGQELVLAIKAEGKTTLVDVVTQYPKTQTKEGITVAIRDIQSEENRDLICKIHIAPEPSDNETKLLTATLTYQNVIGNCRDQQSTTASVTRLEEDDPRLKEVKVDFKLDTQRNRVIAADALKRGNELGSERKLKEAREVLEKAIETLKLSVSASDPFVVDLLKGLSSALSMLSTEASYSALGSKNMSAMSEAHFQQRSNLQQPGYANMKKAKMMMSWKSKK